MTVEATTPAMAVEVNPADLARRRAQLLKLHARKSSVALLRNSAAAFQRVRDAPGLVGVVLLVCCFVPGFAWLFHKAEGWGRGKPSYLLGR